MRAQVLQLDRRILAFISRQGRSEPFGTLAVDLFAYQYARNAVYRAYCDRLKRRPRGLADWRGIPAVWPIAWRLADLVCFDPKDAAATFLSSGTTAEGDNSGRSRHRFETLDLYRAAMAGPFAEAVLPGTNAGAGADALVPTCRDSQLNGESDACFSIRNPKSEIRNGERVPILALMPPPQEAPDSSLSFMMGEAIRRFGLAGKSGFFVRGNRPRFSEFARRVRALARNADQPMVLASTAFGWVMLLEWLNGKRLALPAGSRLMETGGYKGRTAEWPREQLYARLAETFGVCRSAIVSEYGMCELSSQFYSVGGRGSEENLTASFSREPKVSASAPVFSGPPWTRILVIDPETQTPVPAGQAGLLRIFDLANRGSVLAVQTEDLAVATGENSFHLIGRAPTAAPRGCSLTAEDLLTAHG